MSRMDGYGCGDCGHTAAYSFAFCPKCGSPKVSATTMPGNGSVYTFTTIRIAPEGFEADVPYTLLAVNLDAGTFVPGKWLGQEAPEIGQRVRFAQATPRGFTFEPEEAGK